MAELRFEKMKHMCSIPMCNTITECYMMTGMHGYINALYLCPTCAKAFIDRFKGDFEEAKPKTAPNTIEVVDEAAPVEVKPKKATKKAAK